MVCITIIATIPKMRKKMCKYKSAVLCFFCIIVMREDIRNATLCSISYSQRASLSDFFSCSFVSNGNKSVQKWVKLSCKIVYLHKFFYFLDSDKKNLGKVYEKGV